MTKHWRISVIILSSRSSCVWVSLSLSPSESISVCACPSVCWFNAVRSMTPLTVQASQCRRRDAIHHPSNAGDAATAIGDYGSYSRAWCTRTNKNVVPACVQPYQVTLRRFKKNIIDLSPLPYQFLSNITVWNILLQLYIYYTWCRKRIEIMKSHLLHTPWSIKMLLLFFK